MNLRLKNRFYAVSLTALLLSPLPNALRGEELQKPSDETEKEIAKLLLNLKTADKKLYTVDERIKRLEQTDLRTELSGDFDPLFRIEYGSLYMFARGYDNAIDSFYEALLKAPSLKDNEIKKIGGNLLLAWIEKKSKVSSRFYIKKVLGGEVPYPGAILFESFLTNELLLPEDYGSLRRYARSVSAKEKIDPYLFAKVALKFRDYGTVSEQLNLLSDDSAYAPQKHYALGVLLVKEGKLDEAEKHFLKAGTLSAGGEKGKGNIIADSSHAAIARLALQKNDYLRAVDYYSRIPMNSPIFSDSLLEKSYAYYKLSEFKQSLESLDYLLISRPQINVFLDAMKIKGKELVPGDYSQAEIEGYNDLVTRLEYESLKLDRLKENYRGAEEGLLGILNLSERPHPVKAIPSNMLVKTLENFPVLKTFEGLEDELNLMGDELDKLSSLVSHMGKTLDELTLSPSLNRTYEWMVSTERALLSLVAAIASDTVGTLTALKVEIPGKMTAAFSGLNDLSSTPYMKGCETFRGKFSESLSEERTVVTDILGLLSKTRDLNELSSSGWGLMDGEREKIALEYKKEISSEYDTVTALKNEAEYYFSDLKISSYRLSRLCLTSMLSYYSSEIPRATRALSELRDFAAPRLAAAGGADSSSALSETVSTVLRLAEIPKRLDSFIKKLSAEERAMLTRAKSRLSSLKQENAILIKQFEAVRGEFNLGVRPFVRGVLRKIAASFGDYVQSYDWGLVSSYFEQKKRQKNELKELLILREAEMSRANGTFRILRDSAE